MGERAAQQIGFDDSKNYKKKKCLKVIIKCTGFFLMAGGGCRADEIVLKFYRMIVHIGIFWKTIIFTTYLSVYIIS